MRSGSRVKETNLLNFGRYFLVFKMNPDALYLIGRYLQGMRYYIYGAKEEGNKFNFYENRVKAIFHSFEVQYTIF